MEAIGGDAIKELEAMAAALLLKCWKVQFLVAVGREKDVSSEK